MVGVGVWVGVSVIVGVAVGHAGVVTLNVVHVSGVHAASGMPGFTLYVRVIAQPYPALALVSV